MGQRQFIAGFQALTPTNRRKPVVAVWIAFLLLVVAFPAHAAELRPKVAVVAFGLFGDQSVFESEAAGAAKIVADRFGADPVIVRANTRSRTDATVATLEAALDEAAAGLDTDNDVLAVILTSHGSRGGVAVKPAGEREDMLWPQILAAMLNHTGVRHRMVIVSACYSGVFIPPLANADTLVITAADAFHPSFGCQDGAEWTYFGDAFFNIAMRRSANLRVAFELARSLIRDRELSNGFEPSNPQMAGGENVLPRLSGSLEPTAATLLPWPVR
jgi:hypothetical protein